MNIYLAKLKEKPVPNIRYKNGLSIFLGQHQKEVVEGEERNDEELNDQEPIEEEKKDDVQEDGVKRLCKITDNRSKDGFDYNRFMESLRKQHVFPVKKQLKPLKIM